jgi:hypothetical protein
VFAQGGEHDVFFQKRSGRYLKATRQDRHKGYGIALGSHIHGATPSEYLDRLFLQNCIFDDDIRLERVVQNDGKPIIITSQPAIKGSTPRQGELDELMIEKGYEKLAEGAYYGHIYPIDPVIQRITPDFGRFLRQEPYTINLPR